MGSKQNKMELVLIIRWIILNDCVCRKFFTSSGREHGSRFCGIVQRYFENAKKLFW